MPSSVERLRVGERSEGGGRISEDQMTEIGCQGTGDRDRRSEVGGYMTEDRDQKSEVGEQKKGGGRRAYGTCLPWGYLRPSGLRFSGTVLRFLRSAAPHAVSAAAAALGSVGRWERGMLRTVFCENKRDINSR
jgi:hypothetical protein